MKEFKLRAMNAGDRSEVAELIYLSTNSWYESHGRPRTFSGDPVSADIFYEVYDALDPECGLVVEHTRTKRLIGSWFVHPRPTHVSLGIMNSHPNYSGRGLRAKQQSGDAGRHGADEIGKLLMKPGQVRDLGRRGIQEVHFHVAGVLAGALQALGGAHDRGRSCC
jgi:hypothetical protein